MRIPSIPGCVSADGTAGFAQRGFVSGGSLELYSKHHLYSCSGRYWSCPGYIVVGCHRIALCILWHRQSITGCMLLRIGGDRMCADLHSTESAIATKAIIRDYELALRFFRAAFRCADARCAGEQVSPKPPVIKQQCRFSS